MAILQDMTQDQMKAEIERLTAANARLKAASQSKLTLKVGQAGGVSLYGLGRWPVTLYRSQWERLIAHVKSGAVEAFIEDNAESLSSKD